MNKRVDIEYAVTYPVDEYGNDKTEYADSEKDVEEIYLRLPEKWKEWVFIEKKVSIDYHEE